ncbi:MAG: diaminobutyrate acetyltransferase [Candidatus Sumerlaeia bacterium]|nr:diaminobutyrate acetyltransferase [Candidatus Sumerlaeia bacterium]
MSEGKEANLSPSTQDQDAVAIRYREPVPQDGAPIHSLIDTCKPLDLNSLYCYLLVATHFAATSVVAEDNEGIGGCISAYILPSKPDTVFVWQVAVHPRMRGKGLAGKMLHEIIERKACGKVRFMETTVSPSNTASKRLFASFARSLGTEITEQTFFTAEHFGKEQHEDEVLHRIGPFTPPNTDTQRS